MPESITNDEFATLCRQINSNSTKLSSWESDFMDSINNRIDAHLFITSRQINKVREIHERIFG